MNANEQSRVEDQKPATQKQEVKVSRCAPERAPEADHRRSFIAIREINHHNRMEQSMQRLEQKERPVLETTNPRDLSRPSTGIKVKTSLRAAGGPPGPVHSYP